MESIQVNSIFQPLWSDIKSEDTFPNKRPLLAHYTSITTLESVVKSDEVWFSNPLNMNDMSELRFGILSAVEAFRAYRNKLIEACESVQRFDILSNAFETLFHEFDSEHVLDTYIFCFSEHDPTNTDGRLSMWRAYGANGNGASIVIDTNKLDAKDGQQPIFISAVQYMSVKDKDTWIQNKLGEFATILLEGKLPTDQLPLAARNLFQRFKIFAIFSKHCGFEEEREWRVVYMESFDSSKTYKNMLGYSNTPRGVQLKFKFKVKPIPGITAEDFSLEKIISNIILGPTNYNYLAIQSVKRMLDLLGRPELAKKVICSSIPFRPL